MNLEEIRNNRLKNHMEQNLADYSKKNILKKFLALCSIYKKQYVIPSGKDLIIASRIAKKLEAIKETTQFFEFLENQVRQKENIISLAKICYGYQDAVTAKQIIKNKEGDYVL